MKKIIPGHKDYEIIKPLGYMHPGTYGVYLSRLNY